MPPILTSLSADFNPHSREGSDNTAYVLLQACNNFNPHSREGSDSPLVWFPVLEPISIHTPAKGVTMENESESGSIIISIHTPAKGVTQVYADTIIAA